MGKTRSAGWVGGTVVLVLAVLLGTWFMLALPRLAAAEETRLQADETKARNDLLELEVAQLRADFLKLDDYRAQLEAIKVQVPPEKRLPDITNMINQLAVNAMVTVTEISPAPAVVVSIPTPLVVAQPAADPAVDPAVEEAEATADEAEAAADDQADTEPAAPAAPTGPAQIEGFVAIPLSVKIIGPYPNVVAFLEQLQMREGRLFLVTELDAIRQKTAEATSGKPPTADGDLELKITGYFYTLTDLPGLTPAVEGEDGEEPAEPVMPGSDRNPFVPLAPTGSGDTSG